MRARVYRAAPGRGPATQTGEAVQAEPAPPPLGGEGRATRGPASSVPRKRAREVDGFVPALCRSVPAREPPAWGARTSALCRKDSLQRDDVVQAQIRRPVLVL